MIERRKETEARRRPPIRDAEMDQMCERILMDLIRDEAPVDDYWFIVDTGWNIPREQR